jgi:hypothetical protein
MVCGASPFQYRIRPARFSSPKPNAPSDSAASAPPCQAQRHCCRTQGPSPERCHHDSSSGCSRTRLHRPYTRSISGAIANATPTSPAATSQERPATAKAPASSASGSAAASPPVHGVKASHSQSRSTVGSWLSASYRRR